MRLRTSSTSGDRPVDRIAELMRYREASIHHLAEVLRPQTEAWIAELAQQIVDRRKSEATTTRRDVVGRHRREDPLSGDKRAATYHHYNPD